VKVTFDRRIRRADDLNGLTGLAAGQVLDLLVDLLPREAQLLAGRVQPVVEPAVGQRDAGRRIRIRTWPAKQEQPFALEPILQSRVTTPAL
jgi:hypothetical protein